MVLSGQYKVNSLGTNEISYNILNLRHMSKVATLSEEKQNVYIFIQVVKQRKWKNIKKWGCRAVFRNLKNIYDGASLRKYNS